MYFAACPRGRLDKELAVETYLNSKVEVCNNYRVEDADQIIVIRS